MSVKPSKPSPHGMAGDVIRAAKRLSNEQQVVLRALHECDDTYGFNYTNFRRLSRKTMMRRARVRVVTRQLAKKGLAQYSSGLVTEDGQVAGSGYAVTELGRIVAQVI